MQEKNLLARSFILSFGVTFLLFSIGAAVAVFIVNPPVRSYPGGEVELSEINRYLPAQEEAMTALVAIGQERPHTFVLLGFEPFKGSLPVLALSPETLLGQGENTQQLGEIYESDGMSGAIAAMAEKLGVSIERSARLTDEQLAALTDSFGPVEYVLPQKVEFRNMGTALTLEAGVQRLSGSELAAVVTYGSYSGGELARTEIAAQVIARAINEYLPMVNNLETDDFYRRVTEHMQCDISYTDVAQRIQGARFLVRLKDDAAQAVRPDRPMLSTDRGIEFNERSIAGIAQLYH